MSQINVLQIVLDTISEQAKRRPGGYFQADLTIPAIREKLNNPDLGDEMFTCWSDLLRHGIIALANPDGCFQGLQRAGVYFLTKVGERTMEHASRDPINHAGYMAYLDSQAQVDPITRGYVEEALNTYRACCYKATAVMIGAATENLVLNLRDELVKTLKARGDSVPNDMESWKAKPLFEAVANRILADLKTDFKRTKDEDKRHLLEDAEARLRSAAGEFRKTRNDAGHPASLDPVNPADVHCNLLLFPATAKLISKLKKWVIDFYVP